MHNNLQKLFNSSIHYSKDTASNAKPFQKLCPDAFPARHGAAAGKVLRKVRI
jgi:hypothetical protein